MRNIVIGTCGHVDHGKTALIKTLTGIDTDRLKEEKTRGISIEAGFAYLDTPDGTRLGIVDVPGHERFIGNMLAAANGIGLALLVVAADEGVMPQTREHLDILELLNVKHGIIAVTKLDLADAKALEITREQIKEAVAKTFLKDAQIVEVSAKTGAGLDALREAIYKTAAELPPTRSGGRFRLPIDRVFTMRGFGTVVTGTLIDGGLGMSASAMLYPTMRNARIRGLQVHSKAVEQAEAGERVAVNLALKKDEISRGDVLAETGTLVPSMMLDVALTVLESSPFTVKNNSRAHLYIGGKRLIAKIILLEADELSASGRGFAQLRLAEPVAAKRGDRFILRFYSPEVTVGGGEVLDAVPQKRRRFKQEVIERLSSLQSGLEPTDKSLHENNKPIPAASSGVSGQMNAPRGGEINPNSVTHLSRAHGAGGSGVTPVKQKKQAESLPTDEVEQIYHAFGMNPSAAAVAAAHMDKSVFSRTAALLVKEKKLVRLDNAIYMHKSCYNAALGLYQQLEAANSVALGQYRDALQTSRRVAFALFEHFEAIGIRKR